MGEVLSVQDLWVEYGDHTTALKGISLAIAEGERVGLLGPNGAGKTSLLLALMRGVSSRGRIVVDGVELSRRTADRARSRCGMAFQNPDDQLFMPSLLADVAFGPLNQGLTPEQAEAAARSAIAAVGLHGLEARSAHHLSVGQKRNAALATILSMQVKILLLDEPGANLDHRGHQRLVELLSGRSEAMLLATHDLPMVRRLCPRVLVLDGGQIVADGPTEQVLSDAAFMERHGLG
ncbi:MAG: Cobalt import ATP-binding protein CbiO [Planctomycetes bacterium ADurb.Bin126]|nr:MAG: Cobalt import ATP-binding protein CbiO [Planctomycetes bacterium ADurb.Bin126]HOD81323.1 ABC transporter ATP-binding protein [Phycisphaerae bacterium]HQL74573.1 ABC transporter ATP-binding protein [Phycisphaerae bacterium]